MSVKIIYSVSHGRLIHDEEFTVSNNKILLPDCCGNGNYGFLNNEYSKFKNQILNTLPNLLVTKKAFYNNDSKNLIKKPYTLYTENDKLCDINNQFTNLLEFKENDDIMDYIEDLNNFDRNKGIFDISKMNNRGYNLFMHLYNVLDNVEIINIIADDKKFEKNGFSYNEIIKKIIGQFVNGLLNILYAEMYSDNFYLFSINGNDIEIDEKNILRNFDMILITGEDSLDKLIKELPNFERSIKKYETLINQLYDTNYLSLFKQLNKKYSITLSLLKYISNNNNLLTTKISNINVFKFFTKEKTGSETIMRVTNLSLEIELSTYINNYKFISCPIGNYFYNIIYNVVNISTFSVLSDLRYKFYSNVKFNYGIIGSFRIPMIKLSAIFNTLNEILPTTQFILLHESCQSYKRSNMCELYQCQLNTIINKYIKDYVNHIKSSYITEDNALHEIDEILKLPEFYYLSIDNKHKHKLEKNNPNLLKILDFILNYYEDKKPTYKTKVLISHVYHVLYLLMFNNKYKKNVSINFYILYIAVILICDEIKMYNFCVTNGNCNYTHDINKFIDAVNYFPHVFADKLKYSSVSVFDNPDEDSKLDSPDIDRDSYFVDSADKEDTEDDSETEAESEIGRAHV